MNTRLVILLTLALLLTLPGMLPALAPPTLKLHAGQVTAPSVDAIFGQSAAASSRWIAVGEPGNDEQTLNAGAVHIFDARNGRHVHKLFAQDTAASREFGHSVALWGDLLVVGAISDSEVGVNAGAAYLFDLRSGAQLAKWTASDGMANARFGASVAISGDLALVGAWGDSALAIEAGAAYVFRSSTGAELHKLTASDAGADHRFGLSVALQNGVAVVGSPEADGAGADSGAVYVFDAKSGAEVEKYFAAGGAVGDFFGGSVALDGTLIMIGAPGEDMGAANAGAVYFFDWKLGVELKAVTALPYAAVNDGFGSKVALSEGVALASSVAKDGYRGAVYRIDLRNGTVMSEIQAAGGKALDFFGESLAVSGNQIFVGAPTEDGSSPDTGAVHWIRGVEATLPLRSQLRAGNAAPGAPGALINRLGSASINNQGMVMLDASLRGTGAQGGRNQGLWSSLGATDVQSLLLQRQDALDTLGVDFTDTFVARATGAALNQGAYGVVRATLRGPGVGRFNNQAVLLDNGAGLVPVVRTGSPLVVLGGASLRSVREVAQNRSVPVPRIAMLCDARLQPGLVIPAQDSGLVIANGATGMVIDATVFEGRPAPGGGEFGQFSPRVAMRDLFAVVSTRRVQPGSSVPALFVRQAGVLTDMVVDAGVAAPGAGGAEFRNFIGESINDLSQVVLRATLSGAGVTGRNNEGIWHQAIDLVARRGDPIPGESAGVTWRRFLGFWPVADNGLLIHAVAAGPGYRPGDTGLWVRQEDGSVLRLMRSGDAVGVDGARVRRIQRVDVDASFGAYTVLASLTGAAARNQAIFTGSISTGHPVDSTSLRLPSMRLRKGVQMMTEGGAPVLMRGFSLPVATDRTGAGAKGLGQVVNARGQVALPLLRSDGTAEVVRLDDVTLIP